MKRASSASVSAVSLGLVLALAAGGAGCASKHTGTPSAPVGNQQGPAPTAVGGPGATLAEDIAELTRAAREGEKQSSWAERVTFLGWTRDHRIVYRVLVCNRDELGGRGPYCDLQICSARGGPPADSWGDCASAASFELYGEIAFDPAATTAAAEAAVAPYGGLARGDVQPLAAAALSTADRQLTVRMMDQPPLLLIAAPVDDEHAGVVSAKASHVADSPDSHCRAVVGMASFHASYEAVYGDIPRPFAAVQCVP